MAPEGAATRATRRPATGASPDTGHGSLYTTPYPAPARGGPRLQGTQRLAARAMRGHMPSERPPPLSILGPASSRREEFSLAATLIGEARHAFVNREGLYCEGDKFVRLGLALGESAARSCSILAESEPFWCCVCTRPYLEFALRLLWASRVEGGVDRMYSHYEHEHRDWLSKLAVKAPEHKPALDEMNQLAPLSPPGDRMPYHMRGILEEIGRLDCRDGVNSLYTEPSDYDQLFAFLNMFSHANPIFLDGAADDYLPHAAHAVISATTAVLRAAGYRLGWDQNAIVAAVCRISSCESLSPEEKAQLLAELEAGDPDSQMAAAQTKPRDGVAGTALPAGGP